MLLLIASGIVSATKLLSGQYNVFLGDQAGQCATSGSSNFIGGYGAGRCNGTASQNVKIGYMSGKDGTGSHVITIGAEYSRKTHGSIFIKQQVAAC